MHHQVGIATDGRSEVRVVVERQSVVSDVVGRVFRLLHGADGYGFDKVLLFASLHLVQQSVDGCRYILFGSYCTNLVTESGNEARQVFQLFGVGQVVNAVGQHFGLLAFWHTAYLFGHGAVGQQHKLLNQLVGLFGYFEVHPDRFALFVYFELHLVAVEVDGSCLEAIVAQYLCQLVQLQNLLFVVALAGFDNLLRLFVGKASVTSDNGVYNARLQHLGLVVHFEDYRVGQFILVGT